MFDVTGEGMRICDKVDIVVFLRIDAEILPAWRGS